MPVTSPLHRPHLLMTMALAVAAGVLCQAIPAQAATLGAATLSASMISYVALGDSYSAGVGAGDYYASSGSCHRSPHGYPVLWAAAHSTNVFSFQACSGATTSNVRSDQLGALTAGTSLVTITVGGNDVGFAEVVATCKVGSSSVCSDAVTVAVEMARTVLPSALAATYGDIKARAPHAQLVVLGYPRLFETSTSCGLLGMSLTNRQTLNRGADALDAVIQTQAAGAGASYVDVQSAFNAHRICASAPWIHGTTLPLLDSYHPYAAGYSHAYLPALTGVTG